MKKTSFAILLLSLVFSNPLMTRLASEDERTPPLAVDGRIEIDEIRITRARVSGAAPNADLTKMKVSIWIDMHDAKSENYLVRFAKLDPIFDDTGKLLLSKQRLEDALPLRQETRTANIKVSDDRYGPVLTFVLEAPARGAAHIKSFKGRIEIFPTTAERISIANLPSLIGKPIKHNLLADLSVVPQIESNKEIDRTKVTLEITGRKDRLIAWAVRHDGEVLNRNGYSKSDPRKPVKVLGHGYDLFEPTQKTSLLLAVSKPGRKQVIDFEFSDLELP
ncbi:MAG: hypothetical protein H8E37_06460 [Planctomycetes bacterium]|nr:hypothetical protein [Planctomycetota bacterium]